jgi:hypothetical protein
MTLGDAERKASFSGWRVGVVVGALALLSLPLAASEGAQGWQFVVGAALAAVTAYAGCRLLGSGPLVPVDAHRTRFVFALTLILCAPLHGMGVPIEHEVGAGWFAIASVVTAAGLFGLGWFASGGHRGWFGRWMARRSGLAGCPACGRTNVPEAARCAFCDAVLPPNE